MDRARKKENERVVVAIDYLVERLQKTVSSVPNLDQLSPFYHELSHLLVNNDELKHNLGKLSGTVGVLKKLRRELVHPIQHAKNPHDAEQHRVAAFGRISSIIAKQKESLEFLEGVRKVLRKIPVIEPDQLSIVIAGYPNVGKSSLVSQISTGKPAIAEYPFTTKEISIGHYYSDNPKDKYTRFARFQVVDTPGILDRPMVSRNEIEKQAILALRRLADGIIFIFDPTPTCGYNLQVQANLFHEIWDAFVKSGPAQMIVVINKMDLATESEVNQLLSLLGDLSGIPLFRINAKNGDNTREVLDHILNLVKERYARALPKR